MTLHGSLIGLSLAGIHLPVASHIAWQMIERPSATRASTTVVARSLGEAHASLLLLLLTLAIFAYTALRAVRLAMQWLLDVERCRDLGHVYRLVFLPLSVVGARCAEHVSVREMRMEDSEARRPPFAQWLVCVEDALSPSLAKRYLRVERETLAWQRIARRQEALHDVAVGERAIDGP